MKHLLKESNQVTAEEFSDKIVCDLLNTLFKTANSSDIQRW